MTERSGISEEAVRTREPVKHPGGWRTLTVRVQAETEDLDHCRARLDTEALTAFAKGLGMVLGVKGTFYVDSVRLEP